MPSESDGARLAVRSSSVTAYDCNVVCKSVLVDIVVENKSKTLFCISSDYSNQYVSQFVKIKNKVSGIIYKSEGSQGILPDSATGSEEKYLSWVSKQANLLIQPEEDFEFRAIAKDYFLFSAQKSTYDIELLYFPCLQARQVGSRFSRVHLAGSVTLK